MTQTSHAAQKLDGKTLGSTGAGKAKLPAGLGSAPSVRYPKYEAISGIPRCLPAARGFGLPQVSSRAWLQ